MRLHGPMFLPLLKKSAWLSHLIGEKDQLTARDSPGVERTWNRFWYPHTGHGVLSWSTSSSQPWSLGVSIQDEAMDVARAVQQRAHYQEGVTYLRP